MKKVLYFLLSVFLITSANAQYFGIKGGLNVATIKFSSNEYKTSSLIGFHGGVFAQYKFSNFFGVQSDLLYSKEGAKSTHVPSGKRYTDKEAFLQVPVMIQYLPTDGLHLATGPQIGLPLSITETDESTGTAEDLKKHYKIADLRWAFGAGYQFMEGKGLGVNARYSFSVPSFNKVSVNGSSVKNRLFEIGVFYTL